jgi:hypothetical protein
MLLHGAGKVAVEPDDICTARLHPNPANKVAFAALACGGYYVEDGRCDTAEKLVLHKTEYVVAAVEGS